MDGFLNILKPPGMSSHDVVGSVRRILHMKKVGHAGTLDPGAAGVLPVAVGKATRLIEYLAEADKSYRAEVTFGIATDSGDDLGEVIEKVTDFSLPAEADILKCLSKFTGEIKQRPPQYSAIKINGQRAYDLARQNIQVEMPERTVSIYKLALLGQTADKILIDINCSKGTYIRSLCIDIGKALNIPATMSFLTRTRVGGFKINEAVTLEELAEIGETAILPIDSILSHIEAYEIIPGRRKAFCNGLSSFDKKMTGEARILRVYSEGDFLGIGRYQPEGNLILPEKVLGQ